MIRPDSSRVILQNLEGETRENLERRIDFIFIHVNNEAIDLLYIPIHAYKIEFNLKGFVRNLNLIYILIK